ncbi:hypothetical protein N1851_005106 [Merluccius polli]|uniref:Uncharacterized protein n=1 Tax=Merluccius polli TaxID=89951 RepID=A0AA47N6B5_MERPO|nr:hypothetical protein N1851_005106 [Merluccius polli]
MGDIIYSYGKERFGIVEKRTKRQHEVVKSGRQQEIDRLIQERRQLKKQWRKATDYEKEGRCDGAVGSAKKSRKNRKKKSRARVAFYKDPFKFVKSLFDRQKSGSLMEPKQKLEEYLEGVHKDRERFREMVVDKKFAINEEVMPTVLEKPVKSLGRWYDASLSDKAQVEGLRQETRPGIAKIDKSGLPGKLKLWCLQFGLLPRLMWPLTVYDVPLSKVERMEKMINSFVRKWLGVPRCLSRSLLTQGGNGNQNKRSSKLNRHLGIGILWAMFSMGLGRDVGKPSWGKASAGERRKMVVEEIHRQEEIVRCTKTVLQAKQGQWVNWEGVEKKKIKSRDL